MTPDLPPWDLHAQTLPSGLRVVLNPDARLPLVAVHLRVGVGAASDPPARPGRAHLAEHLAFSDGDAETTHDAMTFSWLTDHTGLPALLAEIELRFSSRAPAPSADAVATQAAVATWEALGRVDGDLRARLRASALYPPGHPYRAPAAGTAEGLALWGADAAGMAAFLRTAFRPEQSVLVLCGQVQPVGLEAELMRAFGDSRPAIQSLPAPSPLPAPHTGAQACPACAATPTLEVIWPTVPASHPDEAALDMVAALLDRELFPQRGEGGGAFALSRALAGELVVSLPASVRGGRPALRRLDHALRRLEAHPPEPEALAGALTLWQRWASSVGEDLGSRAALLADCLARTGIADCRAWEVERHRAVDGAAVSDTIRSTLGPEQRLLLHLVPTGP